MQSTEKLPACSWTLVVTCKPVQPVKLSGCRKPNRLPEEARLVICVIFGDPSGRRTRPVTRETTVIQQLMRVLHWVRATFAPIFCVSLFLKSVAGPKQALSSINKFKQTVFFMLKILSEIWNYFSGKPVFKLYRGRLDWHFKFYLSCIWNRFQGPDLPGALLTETIYS